MYYERKRPKYLGYRIEQEKLALYLLAHELCTGCRLARYRGIEYYKNLQSWCYVCSNFVNCKFSIRIRQYYDQEGVVYIMLQNPHNHEQIKDENFEHCPCSISRLITENRNKTVDELNMLINDFLQQGEETQDLISELHQKKFRTSPARISGYVYEELIPRPEAIEGRIKKYNEEEETLEQEVTQLRVSQVNEIVQEIGEILDENYKAETASE